MRRCSVTFLHWCFTHTYRHAARTGRFLIGMQKEFLILRAVGAPCAHSISYFRRRRKSPPTSLIIPPPLLTVICHRCSTLTASTKYTSTIFIFCVACKTLLSQRLTHHNVRANACKIIAYRSGLCSPRAPSIAVGLLQIWILWIGYSILFALAHMKLTVGSDTLTNQRVKTSITA